MGGELFLAAIGGCFMSNLLAAIKVREAPVKDARVEVAGTLEGTPPRFTSVDVVVSAACDDASVLAKLVEIADRGCIMMNTLRDKIELRIRTS
jgi:putative redox protein